MNNSDRAYRSVALLIHIYDNQDARLKQVVVSLTNVWPGEKVKIRENIQDERILESFPLATDEIPTARAELKSIWVEE